jgi:hypothetical protein
MPFTSVGVSDAPAHNAISFGEVRRRLVLSRLMCIRVVGVLRLDLRFAFE